MATSPQTVAAASAAARPRTRLEVLWRAGSSGLAGVIACALLLLLAWRQGGYFPEHHLWAGAVAFGAIAVLMALRPPAFTISTPALVALAGLSGLVVWTALSSHWSSVPDTALEDAQRALVHVGIFALGLLAAGSGRYGRHLVWAVLATIAVVVCAGLISRLAPDWIDPGQNAGRFGDYRLAYPLGYWNAFGALAAMGVVLAAGLAADTRSPALARALAAGLVVPLGVAGYLSFSRGSWLAFMVGLVVLLVVASHRVSLLATLAICATALLVAVGRLQEYDALVERPDAGAGVLAEGHAYGPFLIAVALLAAAAQFVAGGRWVPAYARAEMVRIARPAGVMLAAVVLVAAAGAYALRAGDVEGRSARELVRAESWIDRQWDEFMTPATPVGGANRDRLTTARGTRSDLYRVAIDGFEARPLIGDGAGGFEVRFARDRDVSEKVRDAHSLYLEVLGELGLVGALLLLTFVGAVAAAAVRSRVKATMLSRTATAAAAAACAVWLAHSAVDWDWQMPALTGTGLVLSAALFPEGRARLVRRRRSRSLR